MLETLTAEHTYFRHPRPVVDTRRGRFVVLSTFPLVKTAELESKGCFSPFRDCLPRPSGIRNSYSAGTSGADR